MILLNVYGYRRLCLQTSNQKCSVVKHFNSSISPAILLATEWHENWQSNVCKYITKPAHSPPPQSGNHNWQSKPTVNENENKQKSNETFRQL